MHYHSGNYTTNMHSNYMVKVHAVCLFHRCVHFKYGMQVEVQVHLLLLRARTFVVGRWGVNLAMAKGGQF